MRFSFTAAPFHHLRRSNDPHTALLLKTCQPSLHKARRAVVAQRRTHCACCCRYLCNPAFNCQDNRQLSGMVTVVVANENRRWYLSCLPALMEIASTVLHLLSQASAAPNCLKADRHTPAPRSARKKAFLQVLISPHLDRKAWQQGRKGLQK